MPASDTSAIAPAAAEFARPIRPVRIFLSYASDDEDIVQAFERSFNALNTMTGNLRTWWDKKSLQVGSSNPLRDEIEENLLLTDYLVILYTGAMKKSHSYTGEELGFFRGLIRADEQKGGKSRRKVIPIYFGERPPVEAGELGINLEISPTRLRMQRSEFQSMVLQAVSDPHNTREYGSVISTYQAIAKEADDRLPPESGESSYPAGQWQDRIERRNELIRNEIIPVLMRNLYDCFSRRVRRKSVEQKLIQFEIPKEYSSTNLTSALPDDTKVTAFGNAFSLFKIADEGDVLRWDDFKSSLQTSIGANAGPTIASIERSAVSAMSPTLDRDDDQIINSPDGVIYRVIITKQFEYYDGSKLAHMYFIPMLRTAILEHSRSAVTLGFVNMATRYRDLFLNPASDLSIMEFQRDSEFAVFSDKVRQVRRQLMLIEDQAHVLGLDQTPAIATYYGSTERDAADICDMSKKWSAVRKNLMAAAEAVLCVKPGDKAEDKTRAAWLTALRAFIDSSNAINVKALSRAIANLEAYLFKGGDYISEPQVASGPDQGPPIVPTAMAS